MAVSDILAQDAAFIESWLQEYFLDIGKDAGYPRKLIDAASYSLFAGGKRLRPCLALITNRLFGGEDREVAPLAGALELIHTYSLIHDDLPAMDDDDLRRGKPTCHKQYGEAEAILAGDALLTEAFVMCSTLACDPGLVVRIIRELAGFAGFGGMVAGQSADLAAEVTPVGAEGLSFIHKNKTGALIRASLYLAAVASGAGSQAAAALGDFGSALGMIFQITDDILDQSGDEALLGKPIGSDERQGKTTYVSLYGLAEAGKMASAWGDRAVGLLEPFGKSGETLREMVQLILERRS